MLKLTLQVLSFILGAIILASAALFLSTWSNVLGFIFCGLGVVFCSLVAWYEAKPAKPWYYSLIKRR